MAIYSDTSNAASPPAGAPLLRREELEALLPDFAFGELSESDAARVDASLPAFPDLQAELTLIQESFADIEGEIEILERTNAQRLRNLGVHVQERLREENARSKRRWQWFRILIPSLAAAAILAVVVMPNRLSDALRERLGIAAGAKTNETALDLKPEEIEQIRAIPEPNALQSGLLDADAGVNDKALADAMNTSFSTQETTMASKMLRKETMKALANNTSAFHGYFDNSADMQNISDEDVANVAAALTEM
ncbi:MAG: hypothetical protein EAZ92_05660 [Candidatus Kapaibacterium sp.]|nr:MAG: hypothetical protein EAZ92_05660 [Candidatus Kapabacteria bacterium]